MDGEPDPSGETANIGPEQGAPGQQVMQRRRRSAGADGAVASGNGLPDLTQPADWTIDPEGFFRNDYRPWIDRLRNIQTVLGDGDAITQELDRIALDMERFRRETHRTGLAPRFELFLEAVALPLHAAAQELEMRLRRAAGDRDLFLPESEEVPAQYQKLVADYFEYLSAGAEPAGP
jgi:hypothetical protein